MLVIAIFYGQNLMRRVVVIINFLYPEEILLKSMRFYVEHWVFNIRPMVTFNFLLNTA